MITAGGGARTYARAGKGDAHHRECAALAGAAGRCSERAPTREV
jgi:hypothetical protein